MKIRSMFLSALLVLVGLGSSGCYQTVMMTPELVRQEGRMVYDAPKAKVYKAVEEALESLSLGVAVSKPGQGLIVTKRFTLSVSAVGGAYTATAIEDTLQYDITIHEITPNQTEVIASPKAFRNAQEITDRPHVWILDGEYGQKPRWQKLFAETQRMLGT